jgi:hypothetical protein
VFGGGWDTLYSDCTHDDDDEPRGCCWFESAAAAAAAASMNHETKIFCGGRTDGRKDAIIMLPN